MNRHFWVLYWYVELVLGYFSSFFFCPWCSAARFERESSAIKCFKTLLYMHCIRHLNGDFKYSALYSVVSNKVHIITMSVFKPQNSQSLNESPWTVTSLKIFDLKRVIVHSRHFWVLYWYVELVLSPFFSSAASLMQSSSPHIGQRMEHYMTKRYID